MTGRWYKLAPALDNLSAEYEKDGQQVMRRLCTFTADMCRWLGRTVR